MAAPAQSQALFVSGKLSANCTDLGTAYPHGGTALGLVSDFTLLTGELVRVLVEEETNAPFKVIPLGGPVSAVVRLSGWDADGVTNLVPGGAAGPLLTLLNTGVGVVATPLDNVVWSPIQSGYPYVVLRDVVGTFEADLNRPRFTAFKHLELRLRLYATNVSDALGEVGPSGTVTL